MGYAAIFDRASNTTDVFKLSSAAATSIGTVAGVATGGVAVAAGGKLYLTTLNRGSGSVLHVLTA
ncbi:hypothetical protein [Mycolicibacterium hodleri]|uniref:hypothetical protein n=1 Tax=Mycolicibacterium hodleri TaxID=49897 RepID=UPI001375B49A|nr:hypothetical protein [Mycolicibacterium hodleri]